MDVFKIVAIGIISAVLIVYLKHLNSDLAMPLTVCSGIIILIMTIGYIENFLKLIVDITNNSGLDISALKIVLKIVAISYLVEFSSTLIEDFGLKSIADKVVFAGKIIILILAIPIIKNLILTVTNLL